MLFWTDFFSTEHLTEIQNSQIEESCHTNKIVKFIIENMFVRPKRSQIVEGGNHILAVIKTKMQNLKKLLNS